MFVVVVVVCLFVSCFSLINIKDTLSAVNQSTDGSKFTIKDTLNLFNPYYLFRNSQATDHQACHLYVCMCVCVCVCVCALPHVCALACVHLCDTGVQ